MKKILFFAAAAAMIFSSCAKDGAGNNQVVNPEDVPTGKMSFSFSVPNKISTRAEQDASTGEFEVKSVTVFLFDQAGLALQKPTGGVFDAEVDTDPSTGNFTVNGTTYELKNPIETLSGIARVYIGVNLPTAARGGYANETALKAAVANLEQLYDSDLITPPNPGMAMISEAQSILLKAIVDNANPQLSDINILSGVKVGRIVSKVVASVAELEMEPVKWEDGVELTYTVQNYGVYLASTKSFIGKAATTAGARRTFDQSWDLKHHKVHEGIINHPTDEAILAGLDATHYYYVCENAPDKVGGSQYGNTTYAYISTKVNTTKTAKWVYNDSSNPLNKTGHAEWTGDPYTAPTTTSTQATWDDDQEDLWVIIEDLDTYWFTESKEEAERIADGLFEPDVLESAPEAGDGKTSIPIYQFKDGYVHFPVYINKDAATLNNYVIGRNQFIHLKITGVTEIQGVFTGNPSDLDVVAKPTDPTAGPDGWEPWKPDDPIDGGPALLKVEFEVAPWDYIDQEVELRR
jgi:hypothetical protein